MLSLTCAQFAFAQFAFVGVQKIKQNVYMIYRCNIFLFSKMQTVYIKEHIYIYIRTYIRIYIYDKYWLCAGDLCVTSSRRVGSLRPTLTDQDAVDLKERSS